MLFITYYWANRPFALAGEEMLVATYSLIHGLLVEKKEPQPESDSILCINVSHDIQLIDFKDELGLPSGEISITNREKLTSFFRMLNQANLHKYVLCDVFFDPELKTKYDSLLGCELRRTRNLTIAAKFETGEEVTPLFDVNSGLDCFIQTFLGNQFFKYQFLVNGIGKTLPVKMVEQLGLCNLQNRELYFASNNKLCLNSIILDLSFTPVRKYGKENVMNYYELGSDFLTGIDSTVFNPRIRNKIILIGDFEGNDIYPSIKGDIPGILIHYNAYMALRDNKHILPVSLIILLFIIYFLFSFFIIYNGKNYLSTIINNSINLTFIKNIIKLITILVFFSILTIIIFWIYTIYLNILIISFYVSFIFFLVKVIKAKVISI